MDPRRAIQQQMQNMQLRNSLLRGPGGGASSPASPPASAQAQGPTPPGGAPGAAAPPKADENGVPSLMNGMDPRVARMTDGLMRDSLMAKGQAKETVAEAKQLYEKARPWGEPTPDKLTSWEKHGSEFMTKLDTNPGLEQKFVISPAFVQYVRGAGWSPTRAAETYRPAAPTPGIGLMADGAPREDTSVQRPNPGISRKMLKQRVGR